MGDINLEQGYGHGDEYDAIMQADKDARQHQAMAIAITINQVDQPNDAWEYLPCPQTVSAEVVLAVLEVAHGMGVVEWESWQED